MHIKLTVFQNMLYIHIKELPPKNGQDLILREGGRTRELPVGLGNRYPKENLTRTSGQNLILKKKVDLQHHQQKYT